MQRSRFRQSASVSPSVCQSAAERVNACACGAVQSGTCDGAGRTSPAHRRSHVSPLTTEPLSTEHVPHACNAGQCTAQAQARAKGRTAAQRSALALVTGRTTARYNTQSRVRSQPSLNRRSRLWGRGYRPESAEAVVCRAVVRRRGSARPRFVQTAEDGRSKRQRSALEHHRTTLESDTTTQHNAREADAKSIQRMRRCAHAGTCERRGSGEADAKCEGTHRLTSHALRCTPDRVSARLHFTDGRSFV
jgi:hypothetical protein